MRGSLTRRLLLVVAVLGMAVGTVAASQGQAGYHVKFDFSNADGLVEGNDVLIAGVRAGKVGHLGLHDNVAAVEINLDSQFSPLPAGSKGLIRALGLLGNKYVEIVPGPAGGAALDAGSEVGVDSTTSPTDLDQVNAIFDQPTREKLREMTLQGAIALGGRAHTLNVDLQQLRNLAVAAEPVTGILDEKQAALDRATVAFDTLTQKLAREDASLAGLVQHGSSLLATLQARDAQLAGLLQHGDNTFTRLDQVLNGNENNLAGFFARQPTMARSSDYSLTAAVPVLQSTQPILPGLFELLYNMADSTTGRSSTGANDPNQLSSSTLFALRALAVVCDTVAPNISSDGSTGKC
jgi:phospholipid/cholesterol/gamma-HCH transport system substrate-binding protein